MNQVDIAKDGLALNGRLHSLAPVTPGLLAEVMAAARARAIAEFYKTAALCGMPKEVLVAQVARLSSNRSAGEIMTSEDTARLLYLRAKKAGADVTEAEVMDIEQVRIVELEDLIYGADPELKIVIQLEPSEKPRLEVLAEEYGVSSLEVLLHALADPEAWKRAADLKRQGAEAGAPEAPTSLS